MKKQETKIRWTTCQLKTVRRMQLSTRAFYQKTALILSLCTQKKNKQGVVTAEVPCLKGIHPLSIAAVKNKLLPVLKKLQGISPSVKMQWSKPTFGVLPKAQHLPIQILFTVESLLLGLYHKQFLKDFNLASYFATPINHLFIPQSFEPNAAKSNIIKIKLAGLKSDLHWIQKLLKQNPSLKLRLDPNRNMNPRQIMQLVQCIPKKNLDYIEDPYPNLHAGLKQFNQFPLALDKELARAMQNNHFPKNTVALVVKPSRDLSLSGAIALIRQKKYKIIISSAYETAIGLWPLAHLSKIAKTAGGLDVQKIFHTCKMIPTHSITSNYLHIKNYQKEVAKTLVLNTK